MKEMWFGLEAISATLPGPQVITLGSGPPLRKLSLLQSARLPLGSADQTQRKAGQLLWTLQELAPGQAELSSEWPGPGAAGSAVRAFLLPGMVSF